ncbi:MAG: GyrI-like domain-containing protein [Bacteroidales bacterium]|nr:GyrI-like domain-containing protein [Bacteroidales bacterium]
MKILKRIIIWLVVLIALLIGVAYLLPRTYHVERTVLIKGQRDMIFSMVCDSQNWEYWTPWSTEMDSTVEEEFIGNCEVGAIHRWEGEEMGKGEMMITEIVPYRKIVWQLGFEGFSEKMSMGMTFNKDEDGYVVTWTADGNLGYNPLYRYYGLMIDSDLGADYDKGLHQLKKVCEALPDYPGIKVGEVEPMPAISIKDSVTMEEFEAFLENSYKLLYMYAIRNDAEFKGHPYTIYYNWAPEAKTLIEAGVPLAVSINGEDIIMSVMSPGGKVVKAVHRGAYEDVGKVHDAIAQYMSVLGLESAGAPWEAYITDPAQEPDTSKWETIVYYPIK